jgi:hypothetical protein
MRLQLRLELEELAHLLKELMVGLEQIQLLAQQPH